MLIEPTGTVGFGPCDCCGDDSRAVAVLVHGEAEAAYSVQWTAGKVDECRRQPGATGIRQPSGTPQFDAGRGHGHEFRNAGLPDC